MFDQIMELGPKAVAKNIAPNTNVIAVNKAYMYRKRVGVSFFFLHA